MSLDVSTSIFASNTEELSAPMMKFASLLTSLLKTKMLLTAVVSVVVVGGVAAAASTPNGQNIVHTITGTTTLDQNSVHTTTVPVVATSQASTSAQSQQNNVDHQDSQNKQSNVTRQDTGNNTYNAASLASACSSFSQAQQSATVLNVDSKSDAALAICELHQGTFKGTTPAGADVSTNRVFGYDEIGQLLTYAQYLAKHDNAKLTSSNTRSYLAAALQNCGVSPLMTCLKKSSGCWPCPRNSYRWRRCNSYAGRSCFPRPS